MERKEHKPGEHKDAKEDAQLKIMGWAEELHKATEVRSRKPATQIQKMCRNVDLTMWRLCLQSYGVESEELGKLLRHLGLKKKRLFNLLPLLEFITWSLLEEDSTVRHPEKTTFYLAIIT